MKPHLLRRIQLPTPIEGAFHHKRDRQDGWTRMGSSLPARRTLGEAEGLRAEEGSRVGLVRFEPTRSTQTGPSRHTFAPSRQAESKEFCLLCVYVTSPTREGILG